ncbi:MAG: FAD-dependent oxidoreductase [Paracoccaceae bacterium]
MKDKYRHIFEPLVVGNYVIKNRIIMGSMHTGLEEGGHQDFSRMGSYFAERASTGVGLIITGGISPNEEGALDGAIFNQESQVPRHKLVTDAVHSANADTKICMQILHSGPLAISKELVAASAVRSRIGRLVPNEMSLKVLKKQIDDFIKCAELCKKANYDGVEIIGSAGYFISTFFVNKTNLRTDEYGGCFSNKIRIATEIVKGIRKSVGEDFLIIFRIPAMDMLEGGMSWEEICTLGQALENSGVSIVSTHFSWHESPVPTIATMVPRAAFTSVTKRLKSVINVPVITSNRINMPDVAESVLANGDADLVSMARPFLADSKIFEKIKEGREEEINTCIACNQACLDHAFDKKEISCLVNPRACNETNLNYLPATHKKTIAVVGAGPAGLAFSEIAALRGHDVELFEAGDQIGGQFNLAKQIPGKEEFHETIRYFSNILKKNGVKINLNKKIQPIDLKEKKYDDVIVSTGVSARSLDIPGFDEKIVISYIDAIKNFNKVGKKVVLIGAGGIGFDMAELLSHGEKSPSTNIDDFAEQWGIDFTNHPRGGVTGVTTKASKSDREIFLLQRKVTPLGIGLGKTTGWTHRLNLRKKEIKMLKGVTYKKIVKNGIYISINDQDQFIECDNIIVCAGQEPDRSFFNAANKSGFRMHLIGGAYEARELDAKVAIKQAAELAAII